MAWGECRPRAAPYKVGGDTYSALWAVKPKWVGSLPPTCPQNLCIGEQKRWTLWYYKMPLNKLNQSPGADSKEQGKGKNWQNLRLTTASQVITATEQCVCGNVCVHGDTRTEKIEALIKLIFLDSKTGRMFYLHPIMTTGRYEHMHTHTHIHTYSGFVSPKTWQ